MSDRQKPAELFRRSLDTYLAKDMRAWADLCAEDVLVEFPFAPAGTPSRLDGRVAIFEYLQLLRVSRSARTRVFPIASPGGHKNLLAAESTRGGTGNIPASAPRPGPAAPRPGYGPAA